MHTTYYGGDFTHGFDTQNYPKLQASLGTQPENTHRIQRETRLTEWYILHGNVQKESDTEKISIIIG